MADDVQSQTLKAILGLRGLIVDGDLRPGSRVSETIVIDNFGVSRTPARTALLRIKEEGLLEQLPSGGFVVRGFSEGDIYDAIEIRGTLEGMAARYAAERGVSGAILSRLERCVSQLDVIFAPDAAPLEIQSYVRLNDDFHALVVQASGSDMVARSLERVLTLPFAAPNAFIKSAGSDREGVREILAHAQEQHRSLLAAIRNRQGARAQALAVEHSFQATKYLRLVQRIGTDEPVDLPFIPLRFAG